MPPGSLPSRAGTHTALFYGAFYMALGAHLPYWPLWLADWGLEAGEIGLYVALGMGVRIVAAIALPAAADRLDARRNVVTAATLVSLVLFLAHLGIASRPVLLAATLGIGAMMAGIGPIGEALGLAASRSHGFPYAQARGSGSAGFLIGNLAVGALLPIWGSDLVLWWIVACLIALVALTPGHPGGRRIEGQVPPGLAEIGRLLVNPVFARFVGAVALLQGSHAVMYAYGSLHWRGLGIPEPTIGLLWAVGVTAEIVLLLTVATPLVQWLGPLRALGASGVAGLVRWTVMAFDPVGAALVPLQMLHAITFAIGHLGAMTFISRAVPPRFGAAAQGALGATAGGLALAVGMLLAAALYPRLGGLTYGVGAAFSGGGLLLVWWLSRSWRGEAVVP